MSNIQNGLDALNRFAEQYRAIAELADALKEFGSLDNAIAERRAQLAEVNSAHESAKERHAAALSEEERLASIRGEAVESHKALVQGILDAAHEQERAILASAKATADQIIEEARDEAAKTAADHAGCIDQARAELADLLMRKQAIESDINRAHEEHASLKENIHALKQVAENVQKVLA